MHTLLGGRVLGLWCTLLCGRRHQGKLLWSNRHPGRLILPYSLLPYSQLPYSILPNCPIALFPITLFLPLPKCPIPKCPSPYFPSAPRTCLGPWVACQTRASAGAKSHSPGPAGSCAGSPSPSWRPANMQGGKVRVRGKGKGLKAVKGSIKSPLWVPTPRHRSWCMLQPM